MLSKLATRNILGRSFRAAERRLFSNSEVAVAGAEPEELGNVVTLWQYSAMKQSEAAAKAQEEASYLADLKQQNVDRAVFKPVAVNEDDHHTLKKIKSQINAIVEQELTLVDFKAEVDSEDLAADTYQEVITHKNFFFAIDENKVRKNVRVADMKAPGNKYRKPNAILPHEHVPYDNHMTVKDLTDEKLLDMYAYYSYMIDMHIA